MKQPMLAVLATLAMTQTGAAQDGFYYGIGIGITDSETFSDAVSTFTADDDFTGASLVLSHLGDPGDPLAVVSAPAGVRPEGMVTLADLEQLLPTNQEESR